MGKVALYEAPFIVDTTHAPNDSDLGVRTQQLVDAGRRGDAVKLFMRTVGVPAVGVLAMRVDAGLEEALRRRAHAAPRLRAGPGAPAGRAAADRLPVRA